MCGADKETKDDELRGRAMSQAFWQQEYAARKVHC